MPSLVATWGSTATERALSFPCDRYLPEPDDALFRAVGIDAPATVLFRWLCQLKVAPYSYDWIDNFGRTSPRRLIPGLEALAVGQRFMALFELVEFEPDRDLTLRLHGSVFGDVAVTYRIIPMGERSTRLVVKLLMRYPIPLRPLAPWIAPALDLI